MPRSLLHTHARRRKRKKVATPASLKASLKPSSSLRQSTSDTHSEETHSRRDADVEVREERAREEREDSERGMVHIEPEVIEFPSTLPQQPEEPVAALEEKRPPEEVSEKMEEVRDILDRMDDAFYDPFSPTTFAPPSPSIAPVSFASDVDTTTSPSPVRTPSFPSPGRGSRRNQQSTRRHPLSKGDKNGDPRLCGFINRPQGCRDGTRCPRRHNPFPPRNNPSQKPQRGGVKRSRSHSPSRHPTEPLSKRQHVSEEVMNTSMRDRFLSVMDMYAAEINKKAHESSKIELQALRDTVEHLKKQNASLATELSAVTAEAETYKNEAQLSSDALAECQKELTMLKSDSVNTKISLSAQALIDAAEQRARDAEAALAETQQKLKSIASMFGDNLD